MLPSKILFWNWGHVKMGCLYSCLPNGAASFIIKESAFHIKQFKMSLHQVHGSVGFVSSDAAKFATVFDILSIKVLGCSTKRSQIPRSHALDEKCSFSNG